MQSTRRHFLASASLSALAAGALMSRGSSGRAGDRSLTVGQCPPGAPIIEERLRSLSARTGLKITSIETFTQGTGLGIVRVRTNDGSEGYGQMAPSEADISATILHRKVARHVLGADAADVEAIVAPKLATA